MNCALPTTLRFAPSTGNLSNLEIPCQLQDWPSVETIPNVSPFQHSYLSVVRKRMKPLRLFHRLNFRLFECYSRLYFRSRATLSLRSLTVHLNCLPPANDRIVI